VVKLDREEDEDLGLLIAKRSSAMASTGLFFVKSLVPESPAALCDNLMQNDIILQVQNFSTPYCITDYHFRSMMLSYRTVLMRKPGECCIMLANMFPCLFADQSSPCQSLATALVLLTVSDTIYLTVTNSNM